MPSAASDAQPVTDAWNAIITEVEPQPALPGPLHGKRLLVKDLIDTAGIRTTYGSKIYADHVPTRSAPAVERLVAAGAVIVGKANLHEFAWGVTSQNPWYGTVQNPAHPGRTTGGSSGGNAAALAAGLCDLGLATDTGCSIRLPAACCGLVGLKPSWGRIPLEGVFPLCPDLRHRRPDGPHRGGGRARVVGARRSARARAAAARAHRRRPHQTTVGRRRRHCRRTARRSSTSTGSSSSAPASSRPRSRSPRTTRGRSSTTRPASRTVRRSRSGPRTTARTCAASWSRRRRSTPPPSRALARPSASGASTSPRSISTSRPCSASTCRPSTATSSRCGSR